MRGTFDYGLLGCNETGVDKSVVERIQSKDGHVGKGRRWQTQSKKGKGRSQSVDVLI